MNALELADDAIPLWDKGALEREDVSEMAAMLRNLHTENTALRCTEMALRNEIESLRRQLAEMVPDGWSYAGHFYNLVMHALMDVCANHGGAKFRLKEILKELEQIATAPAQPSQSAAQGEPFGCVTIVRRLGHADTFNFYRHPEPPYLDNASECVTVYTHPQQASKPMTEEQIQAELWARGFYNTEEDEAFEAGVRFAERFHKIGENHAE